MLPKYVLPPRESGRNINFATKPKQVEAWINRLPLANPFETAESLTDYLFALNRSDVDFDVRGAIVKRLTPVAQDNVAELYAQYGSAPLPLLPKQQRYADLARRLLHELADSYKSLLLDRLKQRFHLFGGNPVALYLQQILLTLQSILEISFETHDPVPEGVWVEFHQTYYYALRNNLQGVIPEEGAKLVSIGQIYKATLLLAMADPYRLPQAELPWVKDIIARFTQYATLSLANAAVKSQSNLFVVEVNTDKPPMPILRDAQPLHPDRDLLINTTELAKHLARLCVNLENKEPLDKMGLPEVALNPAYFTLLQRLKKNWSASLQRQSQRRKQIGEQDFEVGFGFKAAHQLLMPADNKSNKDSKGTAPVTVHCKTINNSMGGLALAKSGEATIQIRVGDIVVIRQNSAQKSAQSSTQSRVDWCVGLVRWFRVPKQNEVFFGIQLLAPHALAVQIIRPDSGRQWPSLLLRPTPNTHEVPMLLTLPGCFAPNMAAEVQTPKGKQLMLIEQRIESTPSIEVFRFKMQPGKTKGNL